MNLKLISAAVFAASSLVASAQAAPTFFSGTTGKADFTAATVNFTTTVEGFEGIATPTSGGVGVVDYGWDSTYHAYAFSRNGLTINDTTQYSKLGVLDNTYLNGGNQVRNRFGAATGAVLDASYGSLTINFAAPVNSFGIDLATIARGFSGSSNGTFVLTGAGGTTSYAYSGNYGFGFVGLVSDTAFSSITLTAPTTYDDVFDNIVTGVAPAVAAVPEPASWALMIVGFGAVGNSLRRRSFKLVQAA